MIDELEEADTRGRVPELIGDFELSLFEITYVDARHLAILGFTDTAESGLQIEFVEGVGHC